MHSILYQGVVMSRRRDRRGSVVGRSGPRRTARGPRVERLEDRCLLSQVINEFPVPTGMSFNNGIVSGPDGNLWFTEINSNKIGRITTAGVVTEFDVPTANSHPVLITSSAGDLWFTEQAANKIGRITTAGVFTEYPIPTAASGPVGITAG